MSWSLARLLFPPSPHPSSPPSVVTLQPMIEAMIEHKMFSNLNQTVHFLRALFIMQIRIQPHGIGPSPDLPFLPPAGFSSIDVKTDCKEHKNPDCIRNFIRMVPYISGISGHLNENRLQMRSILSCVMMMMKRCLLALVLIADIVVDMPGIKIWTPGYAGQSWT